MTVLILVCAILAINTGQTFAQDDVNQQQYIDYVEEEYLSEREPRSLELIQDNPGNVIFGKYRENEISESELSDRKKRQANEDAVQKHSLVIGSAGVKNKVSSRKTRDVEVSDELRENLKIAAQIEANLEKRLGKPLQLIQLQLENITSADNTTDDDTENTTSVVTSTTESSVLNFTDAISNDVLVLNDFIRFRRQAANAEHKTDQSEDEMEVNENTGRTKREKDIQQREDKNSMQNNEQDGSREPRGTMKEQWIKQPYPVHIARESSYEDVSPLPSENYRAPRVHFVTHRISESEQSPPFYRSFDRKSRARDFKGDFVGDLASDGAKDMNRDFSYRSGHRYDPHPHRQRYEPHYQQEEYRGRPYYPRYEQYDRYTPGNDHYSYSSNRQQRRIIYYATLPEVPNGSSRVGLWGKFGYRDPYDDRYNAPSDSYRYRKSSYNPAKSRYDADMEGSKTPLKVSTDLNVREIKKNPERRIYSETGRRYASPSFRGEDYNGHQLN